MLRVNLFNFGVRFVVILIVVRVEMVLNMR